MRKKNKENRIKQKRHNAINAILALLERHPVVSVDEFSNAREELRTDHFSIK